MNKTEAEANQTRLESLVAALADLSTAELYGLHYAVDSLWRLRDSVGVPASMSTRDALAADLIPARKWTFIVRMAGWDWTVPRHPDADYEARVVEQLSGDPTGAEDLAAWITEHPWVAPRAA